MKKLKYPEKKNTYKKNASDGEKNASVKEKVMICPKCH